MNELPIVILSKELKYSLASEKVKTLEKAIQLLPKLGPNDQAKKKIITSLADKYSEIKSKVADEFNRVAMTNLSIKGEDNHQSQQSRNRTSVPFYQILQRNSVCEIYGSKGVGKTALLLHFAQRFCQLHRKQVDDATVLLLNCATGFTQERLARLYKYRQEGIKVEVIEIPDLQQITRIISNIKQEASQSIGKRVFVGIDMMVFLLMVKDKPKLHISRLFKLVAELTEQHSFILMFTNLVQQKFQLGNQQILNHASYYCQSTAEQVTHKIYLDRTSKNSARFKLINLKGPTMQAKFEVDPDGVHNLVPTVALQEQS